MTNKEYPVKKDQILTLMTAGNATLIFHNTESGNYKTYRIKQANSGWLYVTYNHETIASFKMGTDNLTYLKGKLNESRDYPVSEYTEADKKSIAERASFFWILWHVYNNKLPEVMVCYHTGICCVCGRELTDPESIIIGIGPTCRNRM